MEAQGTALTTAKAQAPRRTNCKKCSTPKELKFTNKPSSDVQEGDRHVITCSMGRKDSD